MGDQTSEESILSNSLLLLMNEGRSSIKQPASGFRKIAVLLYTEGNVKVVMRKETGGQHNSPHFHVEMPDGDASFSLDGIILAGKIKNANKISQLECAPSGRQLEG